MTAETLFDQSVVSDVQQRLTNVTAGTKPLWGKMNSAQAMAHCAIALEAATGDRTLKRVFIGRLLGPIFKPMVLAAEKPMQRNSPTAPELIVSDDRDFDVERQRVSGLVTRFATAGPAGVTTSPHAFFGSMKPDEWGVLMYKHLDHHLRQFGA